MVNPSAQSVKVFRRTRLGEFYSVGNEIETSELRKFSQEVLSKDQSRNKFPPRCYMKVVQYTQAESDRLRYALTRLAGSPIARGLEKQAFR